MKLIASHGSFYQDLLCLSVILHTHARPHASLQIIIPLVFIFCGPPKVSVRLACTFILFYVLLEYFASFSTYRSASALSLLGNESQAAKIFIYLSMYRFFVSNVMLWSTLTYSLLQLVWAFTATPLFQDFANATARNTFSAY